MMPENPELPMLDCGLFRPGQVAWFQIREFVARSAEAGAVEGTIRLREGIPILDPDGDDITWASEITFREGSAADAYARIADMELDRHFRWHLVGNHNMLVGRGPGKGSILLDEKEWDCWEDPCFCQAMDVVAEVAGRPEAERNFHEFFRLQMAYLLLWSSIERLASLRHGFAGSVMQRIGKLMGEPLFVELIREKAGERRVFSRADDPGERVTLDRDRPERAVGYYYQVRSNITHSGKSMVSDLRHVRLSLIELHDIFRTYLRLAERDAKSGIPGAAT